MPLKNAASVLFFVLLCCRVFFHSIRFRLLCALQSNLFRICPLPALLDTESSNEWHWIASSVTRYCNKPIVEKLFNCMCKTQNDMGIWMEWGIRCKTNKMANCGHVMAVYLDTHTLRYCCRSRHRRSSCRCCFDSWRFSSPSYLNAFRCYLLFLLSLLLLWLVSLFYFFRCRFIVGFRRVF